MKFRHAVPILYSSNVLKSIHYYTEILGFENSWNWGTPPTFGGASKDGVEIFFCENGQGNPGTWLSVFVDNVDEFYTTIKAKGANILSAPKTMEWGVREMLVEDPDGHKIRFGHGANISANEKSLTLPPAIKIIQRNPTAKEHLNLVAAVGWSSFISDDMEEMAVTAPVFAVVAEDTVSGETVGCALLLGDNASFYYVKDVMVHPSWQNKRVGTALMQALTNWLDTHGAEHALVGLYTGDSLHTFYEKFGFKPAFGMNRKIRRKEKDK
jgi:GNAT superfamily N-acetyltransferase/catechol 2,3-dioxygenase-like lactoylglutathione lyase family enzyme